MPCGLFACFAVYVALYFTFVAIGFSVMLCDTFAFDSVVGVLAIGLAACSISLVSLVVYTFVRRRQGRSVATSVRTATLSLGLVAFVMLAVFVPLRAAEGRKQHEIVAALEAMTYRVHYDYAIENDGHTIIAKSGPDSWEPDWLGSLAGIDFFHRVVRVDLHSTDPNIDEVLPLLRGLNNLKYVVLSTELSAGKIRQIEHALPSCEIKYTTTLGSEIHPWPAPPVH